MLTPSGLHLTIAHNPSGPRGQTRVRLFGGVAGSADLSGTRPRKTAILLLPPGGPEVSQASSLRCHLPFSMRTGTIPGTSRVQRRRSGWLIACAACAAVSARVASLPRFGLSPHCALPRVFVSADGHPNHLYDTLFSDADANIFKKGDWFRRRYASLRGQGEHFCRVDRHADVGQLALEKGFNFHSISCDFHHSDAGAIYSR